MKYALHFGPDALHIDMEGDFTFIDSRSFHRMLKVIYSNESRSLVMLNVKKLNLIDCTGIALLMLVHDLSKKMHCDLVFKEAQGQVLVKLQEAAQFNAISIAA
ncbi:MAG: STAS domain-containing protein [Alphaproteobacteria bacterium]|nr:STAS domain-containing protein [Alphaproteobacteria bacterium]